MFHGYYCIIYFVDPGTADMHDPDPTRLSAFASDTHTCSTMVILITNNLRIPFTEATFSLFTSFDKFVQFQTIVVKTRAY